MASGNDGNDEKMDSGYLSSTAFTLSGDFLKFSNLLFDLFYLRVNDIQLYKHTTLSEWFEKLPELIKL